LEPYSLAGMPTIKEALLYEALDGGRVRCGLCERRCMIPPASKGFCKARWNIEGKLYTAVYGDISSLSANPIEKKPFFHFHPGTSALTIGTWGCNFPCAWCQNFEISKAEPNPSRAHHIPPLRLVELAKAGGCEGTSVSFNEPTLLFEYSLELFREARRRGLYNTYVSNGYMTLEALRMLREAGLDAIKFDVKGDREAVRRHCGADDRVVWRNASEALRLGLHVEIVNLLIPGVNDSDASIGYVVEMHLKHLTPDTPLHFTRYYPAYKATSPPTPIETLERAYRMAKEAGVRYVYLGNVPGHPLENTYCHQCGSLLIKRYSFTVLKGPPRDGRCPDCHAQLPICL